MRITGIQKVDGGGCSTSVLDVGVVPEGDNEGDMECFTTALQTPYPTARVETRDDNTLHLWADPEFAARSMAAGGGISLAHTNSAD
jgi:hypothetical protein